MNLPTEVRYRPYNEWSAKERQAIQENIARSPWHTVYHLEPTTGLLNDPNGFSYFNGKFHLFYQNWPFGAAHGLKQWVHTESEDLVHFTETGIKLLPDHPHDSHGAYSGSAYEIDDQLFLFYTGNVRDENWVRHPLQVGAWMDKEGHIKKMEQVLIAPPLDVTEHFRDPQIFDYNGQFYAIVGAQSLDKKGFIKLYKAHHNHVENWEFVGNLDFHNKGSEYMIECPNLVFVENHPVLLYSPQGLDKKELDYQNIYPNAYQIYQTFDTQAAKLEGSAGIENLDYGFEAYATQGFNTPDGRALSVSWIGLPDVDYPTDCYDYQGAMSLVKELTIKNGKLYQYPVKAIENLRQSKEIFTEKEQTDNCYELELTIEKDSSTELILFADADGKGLVITIDPAHETVRIDRSQAGEVYAMEFGVTRECSIANETVSVTIFIDKSIFEIFINKGEKVFTGRVFPTEQQNGIQIVSGQPTGTYYELKY